MWDVTDSVVSCKATENVGCDGFSPKVPLDLSKETRGEVVEFFEKVELCGRWQQQACTTMFFMIPKKVTSEWPMVLLPTWLSGGKGFGRQM